MTKKIVRPVQSKDIAIGERIKVEKLSKPIRDFLEETKKDQEILDIGLKMSRQHKKERTESEKLQQELEPIDENI
uniref:Uncharacterized protein n=1 Tax=uncultured delta proteobacterium TaxID=34034 RepID=A0A1B0Z1N1_9DELT|nr:hypothetical protein [uncultured delta proteobacterium]